MFKGQKPSAIRLTTLYVVLAVHVGVIFIPLGMMWFMPEKPKQIAFRVKLGGSEPSHAPEIGKPERRRYTGTVGDGAPPPPPQPQEAPAPQPKPIPAPQPKPMPKPVQKPKPAPKKPAPKKPAPKKPVPKKPKPKTVPKKPVTKPKPKIDRRKQQQLAAKKRLEEQRRKRQQLAAKKRLEEQRRRRQQQVHHDKSWDNWDPNKPIGGGSNTNIAVPIGSRDRGQALGKVDGRTPAGGASENEEKYWGRLGEYFRERWKVPAGIFVTSETAVTIEIHWDARGRVISKRIIKASPNPAVTQSVKNMLDHLDYIPTPPSGIASSMKFNLVSED